MANEQEAPVNEQENQDLGFGTSISKRNTRLINPDGTFNVRRVGGGLGAVHPYLFMINTSWAKFTLLVIGAYLTINILFAAMYLIAGIEGLTGAPLPNAGFWVNAAHAFYFSVQTFTTVGYGTISPISHICSTIAAFEAMFGLLSFALATGLLFGRFSKPTAKIRFSKHAIIAPYKGINAFMFRMVNRRENQLIDLEVRLVLMRYELEEGEEKMRFYNLPLERSKVNLFPLSWTVVHPIDEKSPLYGISERDLLGSNAELMIILSAYDDTFAQMVHERMSYKCTDVIWGAKFVRAFYTDEEGMNVIEVDKVDLCERAELNEY